MTLTPTTRAARRLSARGRARLALGTTLAVAVLALTACSTAPNLPSGRSAHAVPPPTDCKAWVGADRNAEMPGYLVNQPSGAIVCVPLFLTAHKPPTNYAGNDYYVAEFTDEKLKARWATCKADAACFDRINRQMQRWLPPNKERATRSTGVVDSSGKIDPDGIVDLKQIRRPGFFAKAPYNEAIAAAESRTHTVEFTAPRDTFERLRLNMQGTIKLRGWYVEGAGVDDGKGNKVRALAIMAAGGGGQMTAIQHPDEETYRVDPATRKTAGISFPNATTETMGMRWWRENLHALHEAGFDVLAYDRRGEGISGGFSDTNTLEQGEDVFRVLEQLETGRGLRMLTPAGEVLEGLAAGGRLLAGQKANQIPIVLGGYSRGSMSTAWAMTKNFVESCRYDMPTPTCGPAKGLKNIRGAILLSSFASGAGYLPDSPDLADRNLFLGGMAADHHTVFYPNSATLAGMDKWPGAFFGKGMWDRAESVEGTVAAYDRIKGPKDLVVSRGPHAIETWPADEKQRLRSRMVAFAKAAVQGKNAVPGAVRSTDLKELVAATPDSWEPSSRPNNH